MRMVAAHFLAALGAGLSPAAALQLGGAWPSSSRRDFASSLGTAGVAAGALLGNPSLGRASPATFAAGVAAGASAAATSVAAAAGAAVPGPLCVANGRVRFPPMGLGAWAWGDALFWGYRPAEDDELAKVGRPAGGVCDCKRSRASYPRLGQFKNLADNTGPRVALPLVPRCLSTRRRRAAAASSTRRSCTAWAAQKR
jgi:hypothetical protein